MNENSLAALAGHRFLQGLSQSQLMSLAECAQPTTAEAGAYLFREGKLADICYLLQTGRVGIEIYSPRRGEVPVQTLAPGDVIGWSWMIPPYVWQFDARALDAVQALALDGPGLRLKFAQDHDLGFQFLQRMIGVVGGRLAATRLQLLDVFQ